MKVLLVTLADSNYIDAAKQFFSGVYFNGKWCGDCMLLAQRVPGREFRWFRERGIRIKECAPLQEGDIGSWNSSTFSKFYLFGEEFKRWDKVIFMDPDIIIRGSLDGLVKKSGFFAAQDVGGKKLYQQFIDCKNIKSLRLRQKYNRLKKRYDLNQPAFNAGVLVFDTKLIRKGTQARFLRLFKLYKDLIFYGDQALFNLIFQGKWQKLSSEYNVYVNYLVIYRRINPDKVDGKVLHFAALGGIYKPWHPKHSFYREWARNRGKADLVDFKLQYDKE